MRLSASDLACRRGGRDVFAGVNFSVESGESLTVRGRNGAGKSSLLRMIVGLVRIAAGRLDLAGGDAELTIGEQAHYLGHLDALKPALTVGENLRFWVAFFRHRGRRPATSCHGRAGRAHRPARRLSFRRPAAAAFDRPASRRKRPVWLLDEPTSTLDAAAQEQLCVIMRAHLADGGIIVAATHGALGLDGAKELFLDQRAACRAALPVREQR